MLYREEKKIQVVCTFTTRRHIAPISHFCTRELVRVSTCAYVVVFWL
jgi:hypothetical protein